MQGKQKNNYQCECGKTYTLKSSLQRHTATCNNQMFEIDTEKQLLKSVVEKYEVVFNSLTQTLAQKVNELDEKTDPASAKRMMMQNLQAITDEVLQAHTKDLSLDFIMDGAKGYAEYAWKYPLNNKVICTDRSRKKLRYKNELGELTDNSKLLVKRFFQAISERNTTLLNIAYTELHEELDAIIAQGRIGDEDVITLLTNATKIQNILAKTTEVAKGGGQDFAQEFINHLSKML